MSEEKPARPKGPKKRLLPSASLLEITAASINEVLIQVHDLLDVFESGHRTEVEIQDASLRQLAKKYTYPERFALGLDDPVEQFQADLIALLEIPRLFYASFAIMLYATIEGGLNRVCEALEFDLDLGLNYRDIAGQGIERAKKYIEKVARFPFPKDTKEWEQIRILNKIRNAFAHSEGALSDARLAQELRRVEGIEVRERQLGDRTQYEIELSREYCGIALASAGNFFLELAHYDTPHR